MSVGSDLWLISGVWYSGIEGSYFHGGTCRVKSTKMQNDGASNYMDN